MSLDLDLIYSQFNFKMDKSRDQKVYKFEQFRLDTLHLMLYREGEQVALAPKAVETLIAMVERHGEILSKDELMSIIWTDSIVEESNLAQYLHILRKTLGNQTDGKPFIETFRRRGYCFNGEISTADLTENGNTTSQTEDGGSELNPSPRVRRTYLAAAIFTACLLGAVSIIWVIFAAKGRDSRTGGDLTILNLTTGEDVNFATISPDGNYFVYSSQEGGMAHLWLQQTGQASRREIIPPFSGSIWETSFTPDSQFVYFFTSEETSETTLYRVPALGGLRSKILSDIGTAVSFSPDGREMVFRRTNQAEKKSLLVIASSDGLGERVLLAKTDDEAFSGVAWSPDGKTIAFGELKPTLREGVCTISGVDPRSGQTRSLSSERWDSCFRLIWTPDGRGLIMAGTKYKDAYTTRRDQIYYISIASGESRRLTIDNSRYQYGSLGVTNKDEILAVPFNRLSQIWSMDAAGDSRTVVQITTGFADGRSGIAPLADGRVAYLTRNGDGFSIWLMNADGSDQKQLTTDPPEIEEIRAPSSGRFFVFAAKREKWPHLSRVDADGTGYRQLTFGDSAEVDSAISPDENWILYSSEPFAGGVDKSSLWKIPAGGGEPILLSEVKCQTPHYSPNGQTISCISRETGIILTISADSGAVLARFKTAENPVLNVGARWTPDGNGLTYIVSRKNVGNIWIQDLNGREPHPLTDFTSGDIYNYAFSADGKRLFVARGYATRNAVLIRNFR